MTERVLHQFTLSPYCIKVRKALDYKGLPYETAEVNPFTRGGLARLSGQRKVPVLVERGPDGSRRVIADSTAIALDLDARFPDRPLYPRDPALRGRVLLLEDWSDEALARTVIPFKILTPGNARAMVAQSMRFYPSTLVNRLLFPFGPFYLRRVGQGRAAGRGRPQLEADFTGYLDALEGMLASGAAFLVGGEAPTIVDFAVFGHLRALEGLAGLELVRKRPRLSAWYDRVAAL